jgi:lipoic acid synthetase
VPCGIRGKAVTSLAREGIGASMHEVVDVIVERATARWGGSTISRADVAWRVRPEDLSVFSRGGGAGEAVGRSNGETNVRLRGRLAEAGVGSGLDLRERKPEWMRVKVNFGDEYRRLNSIMHGLELNTVCQEAGCPNIYECWNDGTATFMINGDRCTRACGFCLVDTRKPSALDAGEPARIAAAVEQMGLSYAVITAVARDDLDDGGARAFVDTIQAVRDRCPGTQVEVLIPDCQGDADALDLIFRSRPDVLNHNIETVARLQRAVRPSACA